MSAVFEIVEDRPLVRFKEGTSKRLGRLEGEVSNHVARIDTVEAIDGELFQPGLNTFVDLDEQFHPIFSTSRLGVNGDVIISSVLIVGFKPKDVV